MQAAGMTCMEPSHLSSTNVLQSQGWSRLSEAVIESQWHAQSPAESALVILCWMIYVQTPLLSGQRTLCHDQSPQEAAQLHLMVVSGVRVFFVVEQQRLHMHHSAQDDGDS